MTGAIRRTPLKRRNGPHIILTRYIVSRRARLAMKHSSLFLAGAALLALSACNNRPTAEAVDPNSESVTNQAAAKAAPVELPPAIKAEQTFRCKDNSLVYVTFFEGDRQALVRTEPNGAPTTLRAANAGEPLTADGGYSMTGTTESITLTLPGKAEQTCRA